MAFGGTVCVLAGDVIGSFREFITACTAASSARGLCGPFST
jgi:hypothetical protein